MQATFDAAATKEQLHPGDNTIAGSAFLQMKDGGVTLGSGREVLLFPVNEFSSEWIKHWFGGTSKGFRQSFWGSPKFANIPQEFFDLKKTIVANAKGEFSFKNLADGEYYVVTSITWTITTRQSNGYTTERDGGGHIFQKVAVSGGETQEIVLTQ